jgi:lysophospholipase L1-like esterase
MMRVYRFCQLALLCLFFPLFSITCRKQAASPATESVPEYSYLALGDSYTIGQGVEEAARFPHQAADLLRQQGVRLSVPDYLAQTGWTTDQLLEAIARGQSTKQYALVTLLIGVNDQFRRRDTGQYAQSFQACLQKAIAFAGGSTERVFVLSIPDYSVTPVGRNWDPQRTAREIDLYNLVNRRIASDNRVRYVDITDSTRLAATDPRRITTDGLHPSQVEYATWARMLAPSMRAVLP